jgi:hypothetical protein
MQNNLQKLHNTIAAMFLTLGIISLPSIVHATQPHIHVIDETFIDDFLSALCGFPVAVHSEATLIVTQRGEVTAVSGPQKITWTNLETGQSVIGNNPVHIEQVATFGDDFIVLDVVNSGPFVVKPANGGAAWVVAGRTQFQVVLDAETFEFISEEHISQTGHTEENNLPDILRELFSE